MKELVVRISDVHFPYPLLSDDTSALSYVNTKIPLSVLSLVFNSLSKRWAAPLATQN